MIEEWKPTEFRGYEVSNLGRVRRLPHVVHSQGRTFFFKTRILKNQPKETGYHRVKIKGKYQAVHRLVAIAFIPNPENKPQVNHKDRDKTNNKVTNLEWTTGSENTKHATRNKRRYREPGKHFAPVGSKCKTSKLTEKKVRKILRSKKSNSDLAMKYNVSESTISNIKKRKQWRHVLI